MAYAFWVKPLQAPFLVRTKRFAKEAHQKPTLAFNVEAWLRESAADLAIELVQHIRTNIPELDAGSNLLVVGAAHIKDPGVGQILLTSYPGRPPIYKLGSRKPYTYPRCHIEGVVGYDGEGHAKVAERVQNIWDLMAASWAGTLGEAVDGYPL